MTTLAKKLFSSCAVFAAAGAVFWSRHQALVETRLKCDQRKREVAQVSKEVKDLNDSAKKVRKEIERLEQGSRAMQKDTAAVAAAHRSAAVSESRERSENGGRYVALRKANLKEIEFKPVTDDFRLTDEAAAVLGLTAAERKAVDQAAATLVARHAAADLSKVRQVEEHLTSEEGRKTTFKVPAYPEEGRKIAADLLAQTQAAIGEERTQLLLAHAGLDSLSGDGFEPFGRTEKTITFLDRETADGGRGNCQIFLKVADTATGFTLSSSFANTDDAIPRNWRHLIENIAPRQ